MNNPYQMNFTINHIDWEKEITLLKNKYPEENDLIYATVLFFDIGSVCLKVQPYMREEVKKEIEDLFYHIYGK